MATVTLGGTPVNTIGNLPAVGSEAPSFKLTRDNLSSASFTDFAGKKLVLNIFPSVDTGTCSNSVRQFNKRAAELNNTEVLCISRDLPFAQARFCGAEGIDKVHMLSDFKDHKFGKDYGVEFTDGGFQSLLSRSVVVIDEHGKVIYTEQVGEIGDEPNYDNAIEALKNG
ncbi:thiol peroxidase [Muriicola sp. Z0-33]|uniref:thiol peroxidase n=1 Tax=Muriicola sp. Z0-33 TaxID=2816957 RepID=UPI002236F4C6|nr:thiol peroxidase [Muriicola sp. Z0-33]MCW5515457.1 thiol peroxidase [Muriicola sp. Z0-33]